METHAAEELEFKTWISERAERFCRSVCGNEEVTLDIKNEVTPEMVTTEFYDGEMDQLSAPFNSEKNKPRGSEIFLQDFFEKNDDSDPPSHVTVVGPAGSGKTTILRRFVRNNCQKGGLIFVIKGYHYFEKQELSVTLEKSGQKRRYDDSVCEIAPKAFKTKVDQHPGQSEEVPGEKLDEEMTLSEFLFTGKEKPSAEAMQVGLKWMLRNPENISFVIDSIDTLPFTLEEKHRAVTPEERCSPSTFLYNIMSKKLFPGCQILSSSRPFAIANYRGKLRADRIVALVGLSDGSMKRHVSSVLGHKESTVFSNLIETHYPGLWTLCSTPMYLSFTLVVYSAKGRHKFPSTMSGVILELLGTLLQSEHEHCDLTKLDIINKLKELSYNGCKRKCTTFKSSDLDEVNLTPAKVSGLTTYVPKSNQRLAVDIVKGAGRFYFCHKSVQEVLCAMKALELESNQFRLFLSECLSQPWMAVVRRFICGLLLHEDVHEQAKLNFLKGLKDVENKREKLIDFLSEQLRETEDKKLKLELFISLHEGGNGAERITQKISAIDLAGSVEFSVSDMHAVGSLVDDCVKLDLLDLSHCRITTPLISTLDQAVKKCNVRISKLDMRDNTKLGENGAEHLGSLVKKCSIDSVILERCKMSSKQLMLFGKSLGNAQMKYISLKEYSTQSQVSEDMIGAICSLVANVSDRLNLTKWQFDENRENQIRGALQRKRDLDDESRTYVSYGEDGKKKCEAERFEDAIEKISRRFPNMPKFKEFARIKEGLGLHSREISDAEQNDPKNVKEQRIAMLLMWRSENGKKATISELNQRVEKFLNQPTDLG